MFIGSNHKFYKHKYFIAVYKPENNDITNLSTDHFQFQRTEVSKLEWKTFDECIQSIRPYHLEKKIVLQKINDSIKSLILCE